MSQTSNTAIAVIGIDIGKNSFHVVGHDARGAIVLRQKWSRGQVEARLANIPSCLIGMEACVGVRKVNCSPMPPLITPVTATTRAIRRSAEAARCWPHARRACPSAHPVGKAHLQAPQGDRRTLLRRRQAAPRPPPCPLSRPPRRNLPMPARRRRAEYQENGSCLGSQGHMDLSPRGKSSPNVFKTKPRQKMTGFFISQRPPEGGLCNLAFRSD
jgi:hypothetical protein